MTEEKPKAAPGWYPHPSMANTQRYWDGAKWTDQVAPMPPAKTGGGAKTIKEAVAVLAIAAALAIAGLATRPEDGPGSLSTDPWERVSDALIGGAVIIAIIGLLLLVQALSSSED